MTPEQISATRRLVGLTADQLGAKLSINPRTIRGWESGKYSPGPGATEALHDVRAAHDLDFQSCLEVAQRGDSVSLPGGDEDLPASWWLAIAARIIDRIPDAHMDWEK